MGAAGALTGALKAPRSRRVREIPPKAGVREFHPMRYTGNVIYTLYIIFKYILALYNVIIYTVKHMREKFQKSSDFISLITFTTKFPIILTAKFIFGDIYLFTGFKQRNLAVPILRVPQLYLYLRLYL